MPALWATVTVAKHIAPGGVALLMCVCGGRRWTSRWCPRRSRELRRGGMALEECGVIQGDV